MDTTQHNMSSICVCRVCRVSCRTLGGSFEDKVVGVASAGSSHGSREVVEGVAVDFELGEGGHADHLVGQIVEQVVRHDEQLERREVADRLGQLHHFVVLQVQLHTSPRQYAAHAHLPPHTHTHTYTHTHTHTRTRTRTVAHLFDQGDVANLVRQGEQLVVAHAQLGEPSQQRDLSGQLRAPREREREVSHRRQSPSF